MTDEFHFMTEPTLTNFTAADHCCGLLNERSFSIMPGTMAGV
jgi:hypothetical protein